MKIRKSILKIYESSLTPFEKMSGNFEQKTVLSKDDFDISMQYWKKIISSKNDGERVDYYFNLLELDDFKIKKMLSPIQLTAGSVIPGWVQLLHRTLSNIDHMSYVNCLSDGIPFMHLFQPFIHEFSNQIFKIVPINDQYLITESLIQNLELELSKKLSEIAKLAFQKEFEIFIEVHSTADKSKSTLQPLGRTKLYRKFVSQHLEDNLTMMFMKYPMLARLLGTTTLNFIEFISKVIHKFSKDKDEIISFFHFPIGSEKIIGINADVADQHGGESTIILELGSGKKLVYKPGSVNVTKAYNEIIKWVNLHLDSKLKIFKVLDNEDYGWLEFVLYSSCKNEYELSSYYRRAGSLLGITYFLNSSDYHYENLIASGEYPVLIDHETIVQPKVKNKYNRLSEEEIKVYEDSVLKACLLPAIIPNSGIPYSAMCGLGSSKNSILNGWAKSLVNCNTDRSKRIIHQISLNQDKLNKPVLNGRKKQLSEHQYVFIEGFKSIYNLFMSKRKLLLSGDSPLNVFKNKTIRYVWRPTNIYATIKQQLLEPEFLSDSTKYGLRLELLARAYLTKHDYSALVSILNSERQQLLDGNIPIFKTTSDSKNIALENGKYLNLFEFDSLSSIKRKILTANEKDYAFQLNLIREYVSL